MIAKCTQFIRNISKMALQKFVLPLSYKIAKLRHPGEKKLFVFADAHHTSLPFSLEVMYNHVVSMGITPVCHFYDYTHEGSVKSLLHSIAFMDVYAQAKYVFICDTFLPASSGKKDDDTKLVQLCHFSGPFKKIGYATTDDVPAYYKGNVFQNYDLVTASSDLYVPLLTDAMRQKEGVVQALGSSRSDIFYDEKWVLKCKNDFFSQFPEAQGKKVLLWAPSFRGDASSPDSLGNETFFQLQNKLGHEWFILIKHHPHDDAVATDPHYRSNCSIPTERLLPVVDLLITDYSTTVLDYLTFDKPFILYAPDLEQYERTRGFFIDYRNITKNMTTNPEELETLIAKVYADWLSGDREDITRCKEIFTSACDGNSTARILEYLLKNF